jgi:hypothetical protein
VTQTVFLDEAMKVWSSCPCCSFRKLKPGNLSSWKASPAPHSGLPLQGPWKSMPRIALEVRDSIPLLSCAARAERGVDSMFLQQTLSTGYPRLLRLFQEFFVKIAVNTDTVYTQAYQRYGDARRIFFSPQVSPRFHSPETVLVLRSLNAFESVYLARSTTRLNEAIAQVTRLQSAAGLNEGVTIARLIVNELDSARFDPLLVRSVAKGAATSLDGLLGRVDGMVGCISCIMSFLR